MPYEEIPSGLNLPNLAVLDLANSNCLTRVWPVDFKIDVRILLHPQMITRCQIHCSNDLPVVEQSWDCGNRC